MKGCQSGKRSIKRGMNKQSTKRHKADSSNSSISKKDDDRHATTLSLELNDDCLERIFKHLSFQDLFNLVVVDKKLQQAASYAFLIKKRLSVKELCGPPDFDTSKITLERFGIKVHHFKTCLQVLYCFGPALRSIVLDYCKPSTVKPANYGEYLDSFKYVEKSINEHCRRRLVSIKYIGKPNFSAEHLEKPLPNVESVDICRSNLGNRLALLVEKFPNVPRLSLSAAEGHRFSLTQKDSYIRPIFRQLHVFRANSNVFAIIMAIRINVSSTKVNRSLQFVTAFCHTRTRMVHSSKQKVYAIQRYLPL